MSQTMKIWEKVLDLRITGETSVSKNQFGLMPGKSTMEPIFFRRPATEFLESSFSSVHTTTTNYVRYRCWTARSIFGDRTSIGPYNRHVVNMVGEVVDEVYGFKYLGSVLKKNGGFEEDIMHRIRCEWMKCCGDENVRWMIGVTREDRIRNEYIRGSIGVAPIVDKLRENRLRWLGHVLRRKKTEAFSVTKNMSFDGKRRRGNPKKYGLKLLSAI
ncbi:Uncharacterized protein FWK35_00011041 [Aphis craccivora]|uniref:Uncharacterized protein n=1 Tax=Aphis craccivora TaxID=307492 RepID=A0A6G0YBK5_APHCR|nr:Uncharacterized protein FWK35_00011041 [Aphis craccivora]